MIIGIGGLPGSGKETAAKIFEKYGFEYCPRTSVSEIKENFNPEKNYVISPITKKKDLEIFSKIENFNFIFIYSDWKFRYKRWGNKIKNEPWKWKTYKDFIKYEEVTKEFLNLAYSKDKYYSIKNDSSKNKLEEKVLGTILKIKSKDNK
jgi:dephospho-CoA kinase